MTKHDDTPARVRWARLRFLIIGPLLASPVESGDLAARLDELSALTYTHPSTGHRVRFARSTIERWYYVAKNEPRDPLRALERKVHARAGSHPSIGVRLAAAIRAQHLAHPRWSCQLHLDNLQAEARNDPGLGIVPSRMTLSRYRQSQGLVRSKAKKAALTGGTFVTREVRSFEVSHVGGLWHLDFHVGSRRVIEPDGSWMQAHLFGMLDDRSRLGCHLQWYWAEAAQTLVHGFCQGVQKRGMPRALLTDNGSAMLAAETTEGLSRLGIVHHTTLPYTPEQNAKQESFWGQIEGRLLPMLEGVPDLTLELLNRATLAWLELEYNRKLHSEIGTTPLARFLEGPSVLRPSPSSDELRRAFRREESRTQRRSDGTVSIDGVRFEIPSRYRTLARPTVRWSSWELSTAELVDGRTGVHLATLLPLDKEKNADALRRVVEAEPDCAPAPAPVGIAPLLREMMSEYAATGLPPAYLPLPRKGTP
jgi:transposase InsO family protein